MKSFEDYGFTTLDNLPPALVRRYVELARDAGLERIAVALDVRTQGPFGDTIAAIDDLESAGFAPEILFLDSDDQTLVRRYSETRRKHPFASAGKLPEAIAVEREALASLRERATCVWDTSRLTHGMLKERVGEIFVDDLQSRRMRVAIVAFGFKNGIPIDADLLFDVRFLPNPNYVDELRPLTGNDPEIAAFLEALPETQRYLDLVTALMDFVIPEYAREGKSQLTIGIGCTGGRHRSVYLARRLEAHLAAHDSLAVTRSERDLPA